MSLYVLKFGGSSVATVSRIKHVASIIKEIVDSGNKVAVVVSAMHGVTNQLVELAYNFSDTLIDRECDAIISTGEQVSAGLLALCLKGMGIPSKSFCGWQIPVITDGTFSDSSVKSVDGNMLTEEIFSKGIVPIITGFQGISHVEREIHTIGRGGSDASAVAVSYAINADECFIYTDVDGVYTADPRIVLDAKRLKNISYDEMLELASLGAKVLQSRSVLMARQCGVKLRVLSSFSSSKSEFGETIVCDKTTYIPKNKKVAGIANNTSGFMVKITTSVVGLTEILSVLHSNNIKTDFITKVEAGENGSKNFSFVTPKSLMYDLKQVLDFFGDNISYCIDENIGIISVVGAGIKTDNTICSDVFKSLFENNIQVKFVSTSELCCSVIVPMQMTEHTVNILHKLFFS